MAAQTTYGYTTPSGVPGGILDIRPYKTVSLPAGTSVKFGSGVSNNGAGYSVSNTGSIFVGVVVAEAHELNADNEVMIRPGEYVTVMTEGCIWVRTTATEIRKDAYVFINNDGTFGPYGTPGTNQIYAKFLGQPEDGIVALELFGQNTSLNFNG